MQVSRFLVMLCACACFTAANAANENGNDGSNATVATPVVYVNGDVNGITFTHLENGNFRAVYETGNEATSFNIEVLPQEWGRRVYTVDSVAIDSTGVTTLIFKDSNIKYAKNDPRLMDVIPGQKAVYTEIASQQRGYVQLYKGWTILSNVDAHHYYDYTPSGGRPKANAPKESAQKPYVEKPSKKDNKKAKKQSKKDIDAAVADAIGGYASEYEIIED